MPSVRSWKKNLKQRRQSGGQSPEVSFIHTVFLKKSHEQPPHHEILEKPKLKLQKGITSHGLNGLCQKVHKQ